MYVIRNKGKINKYNSKYKYMKIRFMNLKDKIVISNEAEKERERERVCPPHCLFHKKTQTKHSLKKIILNNMPKPALFKVSHSSFYP